MAKQRSKHQQALYQAYKTQNKHETNRKRKLTKLAKEFPNNEQITLALKTIKYRRHTPNTPHWSHMAKHYAKVFKEFKKQINTNIEKVSEKLMFSIKARAHYQGEPISWNT